VAPVAPMLLSTLSQLSSIFQYIHNYPQYFNISQICNFKSLMHQRVDPYEFHITQLNLIEYVKAETQCSFLEGAVVEFR